MINVLAGLFLVAGVCFFAAGSIGLLRLPELHSRLHALTKADNLGLGLIAIGVALTLGSAVITLKLFLIWLLVLMASAASANLIASHALQQSGPAEHTDQPESQP